MQSGDTIVAISSAVAGTCARIIVRMSGSDAVKLARMLFDTDEHQELPSASRRRLRFRDIPAFPAWVYHFKAPRSITGEDIVELHLPGNALLAKLALDELIHCGARQADPGEFTARGFFNGRLNLAEAEGIAAIVSANSQQQLDAARKLLAGELARRLSPIMDALAHTLALIEAGIDFTEEDISFINETQFNARVKRITSNLEKLLTDSERFERLQHQPTVVLAGRPNAGKSTLLNALAGFDRAVVSPVAGTTRDALGATVHLPRGLIRVIDVAGIDSSVDDVNEIETQMRSSAHRAIEQADVVVLVHDIADTRAPLELSRDPLLVAVTKCDLRDDSASMVHYACPRQIVISAKTRCGLSELLQQLDDLCFAQPTGTQSDSLALTVRHVGAIESAMQSLTGATRSFPAGAEIVAVELRDALDSLGSILGQVSPDDVLGKIFSSFCIGK